jgi:hypothetical protein
MSSTLSLRPGIRLHSVGCDTAVIVIKAPASPVALTCGGVLMTATDGTAEDRQPRAAVAAVMNQLGKRYVAADGSIEVLCTRAGTGSLAVDGEPLELKAAKVLPASD